MAAFLNLLFSYVAPFVLGVCVSAAILAGDTASISAVLGAGGLWLFSISLRMSRNPRG